MTRWKRSVALLLVAAMTCSVVGCGAKKEESTTATTEQTEEAKGDEVTEEISSEETLATTDGNMIRNGDFSNGVGNFASYTNGGQMTMDVNDDGELVCRCPECSMNPYNNDWDE